MMVEPSVRTREVLIERELHMPFTGMDIVGLFDSWSVLGAVHLDSNRTGATFLTHCCASDGIPGAYESLAIPVPIPNTVVKQ